jgi:hypothetical protein
MDSIREFLSRKFAEVADDPLSAGIAMESTALWIQGLIQVKPTARRYSWRCMSCCDADEVESALNNLEAAGWEVQQVLPGGIHEGPTIVAKRYMPVLTDTQTTFLS